MSITLSSLSQETKDALLKELRKEQEALQSRLNAIASDIDALTPPLRGFKSVRVNSDTHADSWYTVTLDSLGNFSCGCPSFVFEQGLDSFNRCKHIRRVVMQGLL